MGQEAYEAAQGADGEGLDAGVFEAAVEILDQTGWACGTLGLGYDSRTGRTVFDLGGEERLPRCANGVLIGAYATVADSGERKAMEVDPYAAYGFADYLRYARAVVDEIDREAIAEGMHRRYGNGTDRGIEYYRADARDGNQAGVLERWNDFVANRKDRDGFSELRAALQAAAEKAGGRA